MAERPLPAQTPAGFFRRLAALGYDALIQLALFFLGTALLLPLTGGAAIAPGSHWFSAYLLAISLLYNAWCWLHGGQTVGMRAWKLRLVDRGEQTLDWQRAGLRYAAAWLGGLALGLGYLWMLADPARRAWHDRLSRTAIIKE